MSYETVNTGTSHRLAPIGDIEKRTAVVTFTVYNTSTMQSAIRPPVIGYKEWYRNSIGKVTNKLFESGPGSETEQWIEWTETINY